MLVIRLARTGKKHQAYYRIVVADKRSAVGAKFIEILGNYDPHAKNLSLDKEKLGQYISNGAQPSNSVAKILKAEKVELPKWVKIVEKKKAPKKAVEEKPEAPKTEPTPAESVEAEEEVVQADVPVENTEELKEETKAPAEATEENTEAKEE